MVAKNVSGGTGAAYLNHKYIGGQKEGSPLGVLHDGKYSGVVKRFGPHGWGFITSENQDVFVHIRNCPYSKPQDGDTVNFDLDPNPPKENTLNAINVTGGTAPLDD